MPQGIKSPLRGIRSPFGAQSGSPLSISYSGLTFETTDQPYTVEGAELISVADADDTGLAEYEVTLEIGSPGTITLSQTTGLSFTTGDGTADTIMTFSGTTANINLALDGLIIDDMTESSDPLEVILTNTTTSDEITRLVPIEVTAAPLGPELCTNGDFTVSTGWTADSGWTIGSGVATASAAAAFSGVYRALAANSGTTYRVTYTISGFSSGSVAVFFFTGASVYLTIRSANGTYTEDYVAAANTTNFGLIARSANTSLVIDNVSVKAVL